MIRVDKETGNSKITMDKETVKTQKYPNRHKIQKAHSQEDQEVVKEDF